MLFRSERKKVKYIYILYLMFLFGILDSTAHTVSQNNEVTWNQWRLQNGKKVQGNFLYSKGDSLFFITPSDLVQQIHINQLIKQDQLLAKLKIEQYHAQIQHANVQTSFHFSATQKKNRNRDGYMFAFLFLLLGGLSLAFRIQSTLVTKTGRLFAAGCGILLLFSFFPHREIIFQTDPAFLSNAFAPYRNWVETRYDDDYFYVSSQGIPQIGRAHV